LHLLRFGLDFRRLFVIAPFPISGGGIYSVCPFVSFRNGDGNRHNHDNLPVILAGPGCGTLDAGRHIKFKARPMTDLYLSMLDRMGVGGVPRLGDSTGRVEGI
jgi:hypothetical protein